MFLLLFPRLNRLFSPPLATLFAFSSIFVASGNTFCLFSHFCCFFLLSTAYFHHLWQHFLSIRPFLLLFSPLNRLISPPLATLFAFSPIYVAFSSSQPPIFTTSGNIFCLFDHFCCFSPSEPPNPTLSSHSMIQYLIFNNYRSLLIGAIYSDSTFLQPLQCFRRRMAIAVISSAGYYSCICSHRPEEFRV